MSSAAISNSRNRSRGRSTSNLSNRQYFNNFKRETPEPEPSKVEPHGLYGDPRTSKVLCSFLGTRTEVKTRTGNLYKGHTTGFSEKGDIALSDARLEEEDSNVQNPTIPGIIIPKDKFVVCKTKGVDLKSIGSGTDFTDAAIASRANGSSSDSHLKPLQPWQDDDAQEISSSLTLDDANGGWEPKDMFAVNNEKFNVQTSFNEDMNEYTTRLPDPNSEGYEAKQRFAQQQAEEIERSEAYQNRIAKELTDGEDNEESRYSAVHRGEEMALSQCSQDNAGTKNAFITTALRGEGEQTHKNGIQRNQVRPYQRQVSPLSGSNQQPSRQINNHYQGQPPSNVPMRNQGSAMMHQRAQPISNHSSASYQPPHPPSSQHPRSQQLAPQHVGNKLHTQHQQQPPPQPAPAQYKPSLNPQTPLNPKSVPVVSSVNGPTHINSAARPQLVKHVNGEGQSNVDNLNQKHAEPQLTAPPTINAASSPTAPVQAERRVGRAIETSPEERKKSLDTLHEFKRNFNLSNEGPNKPEESTETVSQVLNPVTNSIAPAAPIVSDAVSVQNDVLDQPHKPLEKQEEEKTSVSKFKLNPNAKEFQPKAQTMAAEAQSPSPQPRSSPHVQQQQQPPVYFYNQPYSVPFSVLPAGTRKRATVSLNPQPVPDLSHVTGQPLLATQPVMLVQSSGQQGFQFYPRMLAPQVSSLNPLALAQGGQHITLEQGSQQGQHQTVFIPQPTQPIPAHLAPHPQPAHSQAMQHPSGNQPPQPTHMPNPAPSPVQQHNPQQLGQPLAHHITQGPPQSLTPQPTHFPQMNLSYIPAMPRTTVSGQQAMAAGHPVTVGIGYSVNQYAYANGNGAQYPYPTAHPQTLQGTGHGQGTQPQYVMMPNPQGHPPLQQNTQPYPAGIQFQTQHNIMQGPPQMPPSLGPNPNQAGHQIIHSQMPALHHPVSGSQPNMYMPAAPQFYVPREGSRSNSSTVSASTIMFAWP